MCNKLIILCVALVIVIGLSIPTKAVYIGFNVDDEPDGCANPLKVDIDGADTVSPTSGWQSWLFSWEWTGPVVKTFDNPFAEYAYEMPVAQLEVYRKLAADPAVGFSRNRSGGFASAGSRPGPGGDPFLPGEYSPTGQGFGMNYVKLALTQLKPLTEYKFYLWSFEARNVWAADPCNPDSKFGCWSTTNPKNWLDDNGWGEGGANTSCPQGGYGPIVSETNPGPSTDSNMPAGLAALVLTCGAEGGRASLIAEDGNDHLGEWQNYVSFYASTNDLGQIVLYGWIDPTDWTGSMHMPLNGFMVVPEPATIALLGLGGLALLRRKRVEL